MTSFSEEHETVTNPARVAGAVVVERLARHLDVSRIWINERGIRDGVVMEMMARL